MKPRFLAGVIIAVATLSLLLSGCSTPNMVRVKPWERGTLADATMDPNRNPLGTEMMDHVNSSREAASGGRGIGGAGCGCN
jgi:hypothetical protein